MPETDPDGLADREDVALHREEDSRRGQIAGRRLEGRTTHRHHPHPHADRAPLGAAPPQRLTVDVRRRGLGRFLSEQRLEALAQHLGGRLELNGHARLGPARGDLGGHDVHDLSFEGERRRRLGARLRSGQVVEHDLDQYGSTHLQLDVGFHEHAAVRDVLLELIAERFGRRETNCEDLFGHGAKPGSEGEPRSVIAEPGSIPGSVRFSSASPVFLRRDSESNFAMAFEKPAGRRHPNGRTARPDARPVIPGGGHFRSPGGRLVTSQRPRANGSCPLP